MVASLREEAINLGISACVDFVVNAPYSQLHSWLSRAAVGLHTMWNEHFGKRCSYLNTLSKYSLGTAYHTPYHAPTSYGSPYHTPCHKPYHIPYHLNTTSHIQTNIPPALIPYDTFPFCPTLLTLRYPTLHYSASLCITLPQPAPLYPILPCPTLPYPASLPGISIVEMMAAGLPSLTLPCPVLFCPFPALPYSASPYSHPILLSPYPILPYPVLPSRHINRGNDGSWPGRGGS